MDSKTQAEVSRLRRRIKKANVRLKAGRVVRVEKRRGQVTEEEILDRLSKRLAELLESRKSA